MKLIRTKSIPALVVAGLLCFGARPASAQTVRAPARVRVLAPAAVDTAFVGMLTARDSASLLVVPRGQGYALTIPRSSVQRLEVSRGRSSHRIGGMVVGALLGGVAAGLLSQSSDCSFVCGPVVVYGTIGGVLTGAGVGYAVGRTIPDGPERWSRRDVD
ncbi:MAG TPA: hypothetical protein VF625_14775 [Longimicrobium sp.]|jgi:hypothetical protein